MRQHRGVWGANPKRVWVANPHSQKASLLASCTCQKPNALTTTPLGDSIQQVSSNNVEIQRHVTSHQLKMM